jgi:hypothetical protein
VPRKLSHLWVLESVPPCSRNFFYCPPAGDGPSGAPLLTAAMKPCHAAGSRTERSLGLLLLVSHS